MKKYRFWLYHPDLTTPQLLKYDPIGWDELSRGWTRSRQWHGVTYKYTPRLRFVKDGKQLVQYFYEKYGIDAKVTIYIDKWKSNTQKWKRDYEGRLTIKGISIRTLYVECNAELTGFTQLLNNRIDSKVDLNSTISLGGVVVPLQEKPTIELHSKVITKNLNGNIAQPTSPVTANGGDFIQFSYDVIDSGIEEYFTYPFGKRSDLPFELLKIKEAGSYNFNFKIITNTASTRVSFSLKINDTVHPFSVSTLPISAGGFDVDLRYSTINLVNQTLAVGDKVYLYGAVSDTITFSISNRATLFPFASGAWPDDADTTMQITAYTEVPATNAKVSMMHETWTGVLQRITDRSDAVFYSEYYGRTDSDVVYAGDGAGSLRAITNGNQIRQNDLPINASLKDLYTTCDAIDGIGLGIEKIGVKERVRVEPLAFFYKNVKMFTISNIDKKSMSRTPAIDYFFNELEAGYDKWNNQATNNLDETNARREYNLPLESEKKKLVLKSTYLGSGYTLEWVRRDPYLATTKKDNDRDNDNFIIQMRRADGSIVTDKDEDFTTLDNVLSRATIYNAKISPMRNIIRNGARIRAGLQHKEEDYITMTLGEGNTDMVSQLTTETEPLNEKTIQVNKLARPLWIPEVITFSAPLTEAMTDELDIDPLRCVEFSTSTRNYQYGFLLDINPEAKASGRLAEFVLLRANL